MKLSNYTKKPIHSHHIYAWVTVMEIDEITKKDITKVIPLGFRYDNDNIDMNDPLKNNDKDENFIDMSNLKNAAVDDKKKLVKDKAK